MPEPFCSTGPPSESARRFIELVKRGEASELRGFLESHSDIADQIDSPWFAFDSPAVVAAKQSLAMVDVLLEFGADINRRSEWWAGSFGVLDGVDEAHGDQLIARGATLDIHSASSMGKLAAVKEFLQANAELVNRPGGDGQRPLHVAASPEIIDLLVQHGAELELRDLDHSATAAQYQVDRPDHCRRLLRHGAAPDLYMAAALDDVALIRSILGEQPSCISERIGDCPATRPIHAKSDRHIYAWRLKGATTAIEAAGAIACANAYRELYEQSPMETQFVMACTTSEQSEIDRILQSSPDVHTRLNDHQKRALPRAAWDGRIDAVRAMLHAGFDPHLAGDENSTPLDRAAFHGRHDIVALLLEHDPDPPLESRNAHGGTPLGACCYGNIHGWTKDTDYYATAKLLLDAGSSIDPSWIPTGDPEMDRILRSHLNQIR